MRVVAALAAAVGTAVLAPEASASITPTLTLSQSGMVAGSTNDSITMNLNFAPTTGDSAKDVTVSLPPGLLADASIDGGACLTMNTGSPDLACHIGSATVTGSGAGAGPATLDLVAPPSGSGDLAGLAMFLIGRHHARDGRCDISVLH